HQAADESGTFGSLYRHVNCMDQAAMLELLCSFGPPHAKTSWLVQQPFGYINEMYLIGIVDTSGQLQLCNNPFHGTDATLRVVDKDMRGRTSFYCHVYIGQSKPFSTTNDHIFDGTAGPSIGNKLAEQYLHEAIDRNTRLYEVTGTSPGTVDNIMEGDGVTGTDGQFWRPTAILELAPARFRECVLNLLRSSAISNPNIISQIQWAHVPEWINTVLGSRCEVAFGHVSVGNATAQALWLLSGANEEDTTKLRVDVRVETHLSENGDLNPERSAMAACDCLASIIMSTDRDPDDLWIQGTLSEYGEKSLQYADHIPAGRIVIVSGNVVVDMRGASSSAALEPLARRLLTHTTSHEPFSLHVPTVVNHSFEIPGCSQNGATNVVDGIGAQFTVRCCLDSSVAAASADVHGDGLLLSKYSIEDMDGEAGRAVIFTFITRDLGVHDVDLYFAHSSTLTSVSKRVEVEVV
ncbi:hypothetical protein DFH11DRAFT_1481441, partial [Phellopilus nigrolimitatus]